MDELEVTYEVQGPAARLTINREAARNALSPGVIAGLCAGLDKAEADSAVRVVVLTGTGVKAFCAGGDLGGMADGFLAGHEGRRGYGALLLKIQGCSKPTIARLNGHALAGGMGLVLASDFAIASSEAQLGLPEIDRGLFPMMLLALLQRHLGRKQALQLLLTGERVGAAEAVTLGLVNQAVAPAGLDAAVELLAGKLAGKSQAILKLGKRAFLSAEDLPLAQAIELLAANLSINVLAEDAAEGVTAFLEKRKPNWKDR
ncbi:MAG: crotonase [Myxococcaceae bacterium]|nr:crotonase [Myxococcaceae bacterium]